MFTQDTVNLIYDQNRALLDRVLLLEKELVGRFYGMDAAVRCMMLSAMSGEAMVMIGPPGTAKSRLIRAFCSLIGVLDHDPRDSDQGHVTGEAYDQPEHYFEYLLTQFTEPSELFGYFDLAKLQGPEPTLERMVHGQMQRADVVFLDEVFNASSAILNALLTFMNERKFHDRGKVFDAPMKMLFAATNHPPREEGLGAVYDRFLLRCRMENAPAGHESLARLLQAAWTETHHHGATAGNKFKDLPAALEGYLSGADEGEGATSEIATHLFAHLRGRDNLVFAGSRQAVEIYADRLRQLCEDAALPNEFYPHHASLSRDHRDFVEQRLKEGRLPTSAVCTSTLELGIDIGDVACVAQIGAPFSVASLRQRLGRSGRRAGQPAVLRQYAVEARLSGPANVSDRLRLGLLRAIAMIELLVEGWCEPPDTRGLHLSTLVHQILSVIAERGGIPAAALYRLLCQQGPFRTVDAALFQQVLRAMGRPEAGLIEQAAGSLLLPGPVGERLLGHHSFYAVFQTPEEYRLLHAGQELGTIPVDNVLAPGMLLIFSGRRWQVRAVSPEDRVIEVEAARAGTPPLFGGDPGRVHDHVVGRMFDLLESTRLPVWLDRAALALLQEARRQFAMMRFHGRHLASDGANSHTLATRCGTVRTTTLAVVFQAAGYQIYQHDGFLELTGKVGLPPPNILLQALAQGKGPDPSLGDAAIPLEKYHPWLTAELRHADALSSRFDLAALPQICKAILE